MKQQTTNTDQVAQSLSDLESLIREELIALHYEIIGARDALSDELAIKCEEINQRLDILQ